MSEMQVPPEPIVVDTPGWRSVKPRIPDTQQRRTLQKQRDVREVVFGAKDGVLTTMGVVTGLGAATDSHSTVVITGLLALLAGALSMGVGEYQGAKSERDVVLASIEMEKAEIEADPQGEFAEQVAYYKTKGFSAEEAHTIVSRLVQNPEIFLYEMMRDEFGIDPRVTEESSVRPAISIALSYAAGSVLPILPFAIPALGHGALWVSVGLALCGLFGIGYYAASLAGRSPFARGLEIALWGSGVFAISFLAGHFIPPLFGFAPISVGG
ncbi:MAG: VIT1/CCC1 transporter family protein [Candidatus Eremiobacteraeota bacterium]|nr:VIT1/CCC1 transporter family protein [Candidatus Eremiobacteraeota bacterium]